MPETLVEWCYTDEYFVELDVERTGRFLEFPFKMFPFGIVSVGGSDDQLRTVFFPGAAKEGR